jgi:hypothetical protein
MNIVWRTKAIKKLELQQIKRNFYDPKAAIQVPIALTLTHKYNILGTGDLDFRASDL